MLEKLRNHLEHGTPVQLTAATSVETAAEVTIPLLCKCKCAGKKTSESENKQSIESQVEKTKDEKQRAKSQRTK